MEREHIGFQGLLERVLEPLVRRAAPHKHREVFAALSSGDPDVIERVALEVIGVLESLGYIKKLSLEENSAYGFTRYLDRTSQTFFLVPRKEPPERAAGSETGRPAGASDADLLSKIQRDTAEIRDRIKDLEKIFVIDSLTQVYNRAYFEIQLPKEIERARRSRKSVALCLLDIDDYAVFNKRYGVKAGDEVLFAIGKHLKTQVRALDIVSRWGGDEFKILLTAPVTQRDVKAVCTRLIAPLRETVATLAGTNHKVTVTKSVGVSMFPDDVDNPPQPEEGIDLSALKLLGSELSDKANEALLAAKQKGKGHVIFYGDLKPSK